jgi:murein DD-endopeptidase MepM/ murein hydrolase activator NlpD
MLAALAVSTVAFAPLTVGLASAQDDKVDDLRDEREQKRRDAAAVAAELDALAAEDEDLAAAVAALDAHISLQETLISSAELSIADAERLAASARDEVDVLGSDMADLRERLQEVAVNAFVSPGLDALEQLDSGNLLDAEIKQSYVGEVLGDEFEIIDQLRVAQAASDDAVRRADAATAEAEAERIVLDDRLDELDLARGEAQDLRDQVSVRVADWQAVGAEIEAADAAIVREIRELEAELARQAAEAARRLAEEEEARRLAEEQAAEDPESVDDLDGAGPDVDNPPVDLGPFEVTNRPVPGFISSSFGPRTHPIFGSVRNHYGLDFHGNTGEPISAAAAGTVLSAGWMNGYGNTVVLSHGDGFTTLYAHQNAIAVSAGESVDGGETVGFVGSTGWSTGPHLHWEIRINGVAVNPALYL